jgi:hypothetical protein
VSAHFFFLFITGLAENADDLTGVPQVDLMCLNTVVFKDVEKWHKTCHWADIAGSIDRKVTNK